MSTPPRREPVSEVKWLDAEPPSVKRQSSWEKISAQLKTRPGQWALVQTGAGSTGTASMVRSGKYSGTAPAGSFNALAKWNEETKSYDIYACYLGDPNEIEVPRDGDTP